MQLPRQLPAIRRQKADEVFRQRIELHPGEQCQLAALDGDVHVDAALGAAKPQGVLAGKAARHPLGVLDAAVELPARRGAMRRTAWSLSSGWKS